jgi:hypothetical protein
MLSDTSTASLASDRQPVADINRDINLNGDQRTVATTPDRIGRRSGAWDAACRCLVIEWLESPNRINERGPLLHCPCQGVRCRRHDDSGSCVPSSICLHPCAVTLLRGPLAEGGAP